MYDITPLILPRTKFGRRSCGKTTNPHGRDGGHEGSYWSSPAALASRGGRWLHRLAGRVLVDEVGTGAGRRDFLRGPTPCGAVHWVQLYRRDTLRSPKGFAIGKNFYLTISNA